MDAIDELVRDYLNRLQESMTAERPTVVPLTASLAVATHCNSRCNYCWIWKREYRAEPTAHYLYAIDQLADLGVQMVSLSGGEPFLNPDLEVIIQRATERGLLTSLSTNGTLLTRERAHSLAQAGLRSLSVSLDTVDGDIYRRIRGIALEPALRGLQAAMAERAAGARMMVSISAVVSRLNYRRLPDLVRYCLEQGIAVGFQPLHGTFDSGHDPEGMAFGPEDYTALQAVMAELLQLQQQGYPIAVSAEYLSHFADFLVHRTVPADFVCTTGFTTIAIDDRMCVHPCWSFEPIGYLGGEGLRAMWESPAYQTIRKAMVRLDCPKCWLRCHTEHCSETWLRLFMGWTAEARACGAACN